MRKIKLSDIKRLTSNTFNGTYTYAYIEKMVSTKPWIRDRHPRFQSSLVYFDKSTKISEVQMAHCR